MNIKKINAMLALLIYVLLLIHIIYQAATYIMFFYHPVITKALGYAVLVPTFFHAILSVTSVLFLHDSRKIMYHRANAGTYIQRGSALATILLLPFHVLSYSLHSMTSGSGAFFAAIAIQILFYGALLTHVAVSFSKALITLGLLESERKKRIIDRILYAVCLALFMGSSIIVTYVNLTIFGM